MYIENNFHFEILSNGSNDWPTDLMSKSVPSTSYLLATEDMSGLFLMFWPLALQVTLGKGRPVTPQCTRWLGSLSLTICRVYMTECQYAAVNVTNLCMGSVTKAYWLDNYKVKLDVWVWVICMAADVFTFKVSWFTNVWRSLIFPTLVTLLYWPEHQVKGPGPCLSVDPGPRHSGDGHQVSLGSRPWAEVGPAQPLACLAPTRDKGRVVIPSCFDHLKYPSFLKTVNTALH